MHLHGEDTFGKCANIYGILWTNIISEISRKTSNLGPIYLQRPILHKIALLEKLVYQCSTLILKLAMALMEISSYDTPDRG